MSDRIKLFLERMLFIAIYAAFFPIGSFIIMLSLPLLGLLSLLLFLFSGRDSEDCIDVMLYPTEKIVGFPWDIMRFIGFKNYE